MRVLMLGWEYPPHISGGLGTACEGLTLGLARLNLDITFVVPHLHGDELVDHMRLSGAFAQQGSDKWAIESESFWQPYEEAIEVARISSALKPYLQPEEYQDQIKRLKLFASALSENRETNQGEALNYAQYGDDIFTEVRLYVQRVLSLFADRHFDLIHAHDWMTFPAAVALAKATGKPLIVHIHSLESDRRGKSPNHGIFEIESLGLRASNAVVAVSYYTRALICDQHHIAPEKIAVVHNGTYHRRILESYQSRVRRSNEKLVLFLGRITFQKGPDYFIEAAAKVIPHVPQVRFILAGAGDMLSGMMARVRELGISDHFLFPGFLRGQEVEEMFSLADLYVMPSVSEPFGISALEAINFDTPVIISKQSGVSEVIKHALKVDFWDIDRMADLIINALLHEELREEMIAMAREEVRTLHWDAAALKMLEIYRGSLHS